MKSALLPAGILFSTLFANAQNHVGIGTTTPLAGLHVADSSVVFTAWGGALDNPGPPPVEGSGRRMMWYADKGAFRVGLAGSNEWNKDKIGSYSIGAGVGVIALGYSSTALGWNSEAIGIQSTALGTGQAIGGYSVAIGGKSLGSFAYAIGADAQSDGSFSMSFGRGARAKAHDCVSIGVWNDTSDIQSIGLPSDRIFQLGNGAYGSRKNALTVLRNGNIGIGTTTPVNTLDVNGKTKTNQLQVGAGTNISNIQSSTHIAGISATGQLITTITFPAAFSAAPKVIANVRHDPNWNVSDAFSVTIKSVSTTQAVLIIRRLDANAAWNQNLLVDYIAIQ